MTPTTRGTGISTVAALALSLAVLPAEAQTVAPGLPFATSDADWAQYLSTPTSADRTTATADPEGGQAWKRFGLGAGALGAGGLFSFYAASALSSAHPLAAQGAASPAGPKGTEPGPIASQTGPAAGTEGASPPSTPVAESSGAPTSTDGDSPPSTPDEGSGGTIDEGITTSETAPAIAAAPFFPAADASPATVTPEPATLVLLMSGLAGVFFLSRRRRTA